VTLAVLTCAPKTQWSSDRVRYSSAMLRRPLRLARAVGAAMLAGEMPERGPRVPPPAPFPDPAGSLARRPLPVAAERAGEEVAPRGDIAP
jgi:hypothetical protein